MYIALENWETASFKILIIFNNNNNNNNKQNKNNKNSKKILKKILMYSDESTMLFHMKSKIVLSIV